ncbi:MAG: hypothetical protein BMS9Abin05_1570 [Rhodothermia bacterium]|nr:MAG: hypothetical protein BMS9Abin05_1570 [Rhodothermia bacterium]
MNVTFTYSVILLLAAALFAAAASYWVYRDTVPELGSGRRAFLGTLRFLVLFIVFFLLAEPLILRVSQNIEQPILAVLIDESQSMTLAFADSSDSETVGGFDELLSLVESATSGERVEIFGFGRDVRVANSFDSLKSNRPRTDVSNGLDQVRIALENDPLGAVFIISDGRHNGGRNPEHVADLYPVPIITMTVGDSTIQKDIRIQQVITNDLSYVGREVPVRVRVRNEGFDVSPLQISLSIGGTLIDTERTSLPPPGSELAVDLSFVPDSVGLFRYRVDITRLDGELTHRNNRESFSLQILEREKRVLLLAGAPSPDVSSTRRLLSDDRDTELIVRTRKNDGTTAYYEGAFPADLDDLDLIVLIGYPSLNTSQSDIDRVVAQAQQGTPLLFISDRAADLVSIKRSLSSVLPARPAVIRPGSVQGGFVPTEQATRHAVFEVSDRRNVQRWNSLPPLALNQTRWEASPTAKTLATTQIRGIPVDDPILVVGKIGTQRSAALLATGFWRWNNVPEDLAVDAARWTELFANLIQWLVTAEDDRLVRVAPVENQLDESDPVVFGGQVYDENLQPISDVSVMLDIRFPNGEQFPYAMQSLGNGQYRVDIGSLPDGTYSYEAIATRDAGELGRDRGSFSVGALSIEFRNPYADVRLMRQIASRSGGFTLAVDQIDQLPELLSSLSSYQPTTSAVESETRLWRYLPFLIALLVFMSLEWFFRKRFGLV